MSVPISDYAIIGDTHTTALISREGSIDWLCWPRHDSPALFLKLLDEEKGGACSVAFDEGVEASRGYLADTNIVETRFTGSGGVGVLTDFMPVCPPLKLPAEGPDGDAESRVIRLLECVEGEVSGRFVVRPTFDYARTECMPVGEADGSVLFEASSKEGAHRVRVTSSGAIAIRGEGAVIAFRLQAGERMHLVLTQGRDGEVPAVAEPDGAADRLRDTTRYWRDWIGHCTYEGPHAAAVRRSALFLKLMTYSPTGAIIAAPTLGLPEAVPGNRNYDYRYAWLRDASFTVTAFCNLGYRREAAEYLRFICAVDESRGRDVRLMYAIEGRVPGETVLSHLAGWRGVGPVTVGNAASGQTQHDIYGELLLAIEVYLEGEGDGVARGFAPLVGNLAERAMAARDEKDQGIWETRGPAQHFLHTKALIWVALDRAVRLGRRLGLDAGDCARWAAAAAAVRSEYLRRGWNEAVGSYVQAFDSEALDASVLRIALFDALPVDDGRLARTVAAVEAGLGSGDLVYRYRTDDGMSGTEGTFTACAFWLASCLALVGRVEEAEARLGRLLARSNDVGLFAEEIDAESGEQHGNFPQGFTHMAVINHSVRLVALGKAAGRKAA